MPFQVQVFFGAPKNSENFVISFGKKVSQFHDIMIISNLNVISNLNLIENMSTLIIRNAKFRGALDNLNFICVKSKTWKRGDIGIEMILKLREGKLLKGDFETEIQELQTQIRIGLRWRSEDIGIEKADRKKLEF